MVTCAVQSTLASAPTSKSPKTSFKNSAGMRKHAGGRSRGIHSTKASVGSKDRRPSLDRLAGGCKDVGDSTSWSNGGWIVSGEIWKHLVTLLEDVQAVGIAFVSLGEGIHCTTAAGRLQLHVLAGPGRVRAGVSGAHSSPRSGSAPTGPRTRCTRPPRSARTASSTTAP